MQRATKSARKGDCNGKVKLASQHQGYRTLRGVISLTIVASCFGPATFLILPMVKHGQVDNHEKQRTSRKAVYQGAGCRVHFVAEKSQGDLMTFSVFFLLD